MKEREEEEKNEEAVVGDERGGGKERRVWEEWWSGRACTSVEQRGRNGWGWRLTECGGGSEGGEF